MAFGQRPIEGAFGVKLGDKLEKFESRAGYSYPMVDVQPSVPFKPFTKYTAILTPVSHRIMSIEAEGPIFSDAQQKAVVSALESTFGKGAFTDYGWWKLERQGRSISLFEPHEGGKTLLIFNDTALTAVGEKEEKIKAATDADPRSLTQ